MTKKVAYVFVDDFGHPKSTILPVIPFMFDYNKWHVVVMDDAKPIYLMANAPDLIMSMKLANAGAMDDAPSWYENSLTHRWIDFVEKEGCGLFIMHAGFPFIPADHPILKRLIHGHFKTHPAYQPIDVEIINHEHPIMKGVENFQTIDDEHFQVEDFEPEKTTVLAYSHSKLGGKMPCAWAHEAGKGRVAVILPGHVNPTGNNLFNPMLLKMMQNAINWCGKYDEEAAPVEEKAEKAAPAKAAKK